MRYSNRWMVVVLKIIVSLQHEECGQSPAIPESASPARDEQLGQGTRRV